MRWVYLVISPPALLELLCGSGCWANNLTAHDFISVQMKQTHTNHIRVGFTVRVLSGWNKPHMWLSRRIEGLIVPLTMFLIALPLSMSVITHTEYKPLSCLSVILLADHFLTVLGAQQCIRELLHNFLVKKKQPPPKKKKACFNVTSCA